MSTGSRGHTHHKAYMQHFCRLAEESPRVPLLELLQHTGMPMLGEQHAAREPVSDFLVSNHALQSGVDPAHPTHAPTHHQTHLSSFVICCLVSSSVPMASIRVKGKNCFKRRLQGSRTIMTYLVCNPVSRTQQHTQDHATQCTLNLRSWLNLGSKNLPTATHVAA